MFFSDVPLAVRAVSFASQGTNAGPAVCVKVRVRVRVRTRVRVRVRTRTRVRVVNPQF